MTAAEVLALALAGGPERPDWFKQAAWGHDQTDLAEFVVEILTEAGYLPTKATH
jgi:hypothetical protein